MKQLPAKFQSPFTNHRSFKNLPQWEDKSCFHKEIWAAKYAILIVSLNAIAAQKTEKKRYRVYHLQGTPSSCPVIWWAFKIRLNTIQQSLVV